MDILSLCQAKEDYIIAMRREFHRHPELSDKEDGTVARICEELTRMGVEHVDVPHGGVLAFFGDEKNGPTVLLRGDIDALPVQENACNTAGPRKVISEVPGVMHACGHDGHGAALLGAAAVLAENPQLYAKGRIILMFERGEEATGNVVYLHKYMYDKGIHVDTVWGLHLFTSFEKGKFVIYDKYAMAGALFFKVTLTGKGGHGSRPDVCDSPIDCFHAVYTGMNMLRMKYTSPFKPFAMSLGSIQAGVAPNVIPNELTFQGTFRYFDRDDMMRVVEELKLLLETTAKAYHCTVQHNLTNPGLGLVNDPGCAEIERAAYLKTFGADSVIEVEPLMGSETFALTAGLWPSAFVLLGVRDEKLGTTAVHHNEYFDIAEDTLKLAAAAGIVYAQAFFEAGQDVSDRAYKGTIKEFYEALGTGQAAVFA